MFFAYFLAILNTTLLSIAFFLIWKEHIRPNRTIKPKFNERKSVKSFKRIVTKSLGKQLQEISKNQIYHG